MKTRLLILLGIALLCPQTLFCQQEEIHPSAPSLQYGLDGLSFTKGNLDAELIMQIIAEKQQEIKTKIIQNSIMSKVEDAGGTIYSFADNIIREVLLQSDMETKTKKIIESAVNLVFAYSFADYYLKNCPAGELANLKIIAKNYFYLNTDGITDFSFRGLTVHFEEKAKNISEAKAEAAFTKGAPQEKEIGQNIHNKANLATNSTDGKIESCDGLKEFFCFVLDMASHTIKTSDKMKELGIMQISHSPEYDYLNKYYDFIEFDNIYKASLRTEAGVVSEGMKNMLQKLTNAVGLFKHLITESTFRENQVCLTSSLKPNADKTQLANVFTATKASLKTLMDALTASGKTDKLPELNKIYFYLENAGNQLGSAPANLPTLASDVLYTIHQDFLPALFGYTLADYNALQTAIQNFKLDAKNLAQYLLAETVGEIPGKSDPIFILISKLYAFNNLSTYTDYLNYLYSMQEILPDDDVSDILGLIISYVKDFTSITTDYAGEEKISFNVESFLVRLQSLKRFKWSPFEFHFTVGLNTGFLNKPLAVGENDTIQNISYVGEKIGIKIKFWDREFWQTRNPGETYKMWGTTYTKSTAPREPVVSNAHLLAYGTGLLYNLVNVKTVSKFNAPMVGCGIGLTFYNALDMNLTVSTPLMPNDTKNNLRAIVGLGFDIQFTEYYQRLNEKRKASKTTKIIQEASRKR